MGYVEYDSNNSGGRWWLTDKDWFALEHAGWKVAWKRLGYRYDENSDYDRDEDGTPKLVPVEQDNGRFPTFDRGDADGRWLGALATKAYRVGLSLREAADEWEQVTGKSATEVGCACCGQPHSFTEYGDDGKSVASGPSISHEARW